MARSGRIWALFQLNKGASSLPVSVLVDEMQSDLAMMSVDHADHLMSLYCFPLGGWALKESTSEMLHESQRATHMNPGLTLGTVSPSLGGNRAFVTSIAGPLPHLHSSER